MFYTAIINYKNTDYEFCGEMTGMNFSFVITMGIFISIELKGPNKSIALLLNYMALFTDVDAIQEFSNVFPLHSCRLLDQSG